MNILAEIATTDITFLSLVTAFVLYRMGRFWMSKQEAQIAAIGNATPAALEFPRDMTEKAGSAAPIQIAAFAANLSIHRQGSDALFQILLKPEISGLAELLQNFSEEDWKNEARDLAKACIGEWEKSKWTLVDFPDGSEFVNIRDVVKITIALIPITVDCIEKP